MEPQYRNSCCMAQIHAGKMEYKGCTHECDFGCGWTFQVLWK